MDSRRVQQFDAYVTYTATRTVDGADERAAIGCLLRSRPERVKKIANVPETWTESRAHVPSSIISRRSRTLSSPKRQKTVELHSRHRSVMS